MYRKGLKRSTVLIVSFGLKCCTLDQTFTAKSYNDNRLGCNYAQH